MIGQPLIQLTNVKRYYQSGNNVVKALDDVVYQFTQGNLLPLWGIQARVNLQ